MLTKLPGDRESQFRNLVDAMKRRARVLDQSYQFAVVEAIPIVVVLDFTPLGASRIPNAVIATSMGELRMTVSGTAHALNINHAAVVYATGLKVGECAPVVLANSPIGTGLVVRCLTFFAVVGFSR